jgi:hypothetical protein
MTYKTGEKPCPFCNGEVNRAPELTCIRCGAVRQDGVWLKGDDLPRISICGHAGK